MKFKSLYYLALTTAVLAVNSNLVLRYLRTVDADLADVNNTLSDWKGKLGIISTITLKTVALIRDLSEATFVAEETPPFSQSDGSEAVTEMTRVANSFNQMCQEYISVKSTADSSPFSAIIRNQFYATLKYLREPTSKFWKALEALLPTSDAKIAMQLANGTNTCMDKAMAVYKP